MQWLKDFVNGFFDNLLEKLEWLLEGFGEILSWIVFTIYDGLLTVIHTFFSATDLSAVAFNIAAQYSGLPTQLIWMINKVALPQATSYIVAAILVRMVINLIPAAFTRI